MGSQYVHSLSQSTNTYTQAPSVFPSQSTQTVGGSLGNNVQANATSSKAKWDEKLTEVYIRICVTEVNNGNKPGPHFNKTGWSNVIARFNQATSLNYTRKMLKNKWDLMKKDWGIWLKLTLGETGLGWDPILRTVTASPEWWSKKLHVTPDAAKFRTKGPLLVYDQEIMFGGTVANGGGAWTPNSGVMPTHMMDDIDTDAPVINEVFQAQYGTAFDEEDANLEDDVTQSETPDLTPTPVVPNGGERRHTRSFPPRSRAKMGKKVTTGQIVAKCLQTMASKFDNITSNGCSCKNKTTEDTMDACLGILDAFEGMESGGELWMYATRLFLKANVRDLFLKIKTDRLQLVWLKNQMERDQMKRGGSSATSPTTSSRGTNYHY